MSADALDAARYRWLRTKERLHLQTENADLILSSCFENAEEFDAVVDDAMAADGVRAVDLPKLTDAQIASACLSFRHDFGLLHAAQQAALIAEAREWERAFRKEWEMAAGVRVDADAYTETEIADACVDSGQSFGELLVSLEQNRRFKEAASAGVPASEKLAAYDEMLAALEHVASGKSGYLNKVKSAIASAKRADGVRAVDGGKAQ